MHGRDGELAALVSALDRASAGEQATVWVVGAAGIGKTRLLTETIDMARQRGFVVATTHAEELEQTRPFGAIARALGCTSRAADPRRAAIASLIRTREVGAHGPITVTSDPGLQFRVVDAFADLVEDLTLAGPVLLAIDDLQWADACTLLVLNAVLRQTVGSPLALIGCLRPEPGSTALHRTLEAGLDVGARRLDLGPLCDGDVRALVAEAMGAEPGDRLLGQVAAARGNPLSVTELLAALAQDGALYSARGEVDVDSGPVPPTLRLTVLRRLSHLSGPVLDTLRAASILGSRFTATDLATVSAGSLAGLSARLVEAVDAHVLEDEGTDLRFRHDLIHEVVYRDIPASIRASLHREAAHRLADAGASPQAVAEHLLRSVQPGDGEGIAWLTGTARDVTPGFPDTGAELFARARGLILVNGPVPDALTLEWADALLRAGRIPEAVAACLEVLERPDSAVELDTRLRLGSALTIGGEPARALEQFQAVLGAQGATPEQRCTSWAEAGTALLWLGQLDGAQEFSGRASEAATQAGDEQMVIAALATRSVVAALRTRFDDAIQISDEALRRADSSGGHGGDHYPLHATRGFLLIERDRFDEARSALDAGRRRCEEIGVRWPLPTYQAYLGVERYARGEWDDAVSELETSAGLIEETGVTFAAVLVHTVLALIRLHRGDLTGAARSVRAGEESSRRGPRHLSHRTGWARALLREAEGESAAAYATLTSVWNRCVASATAVDFPRLGPDLVRLGLAEGDLAAAERVTATLSDAAAASVVPSHRAAAQRCRGLVRDDPAMLARAASGYAAAGRRLDAALTYQEAATAFAGHGETDHARTLFTETRRALEQLQAQRDLLRLDATMRQAGMPPGRRGPRRRPATGWASLTETERAVADLVADGLTNPQIGARLYVSRRTVQTHVSHIFRKLDLSSRAQLAGEVTSRRNRFR